MSSDLLCRGKAVQTNLSCHLLVVQPFPDSSGLRPHLHMQLGHHPRQGLESATHECDSSCYSFSIPWKWHWFNPSKSSKKQDDRQAASQPETGAPSLLRENKSCFSFPGAVMAHGVHKKQCLNCYFCLLSKHFIREERWSQESKDHNPA